MKKSSSAKKDEAMLHLLVSVAILTEVVQ